jgi:hypothetical protein
MGRARAVADERRRYDERAERTQSGYPFDALAATVRRRLARSRRLFVGSVVSLVAMLVVFLLLLTPSGGSTPDGPSAGAREDTSDISFRELFANYVSESLPAVPSANDR